MSVVWGVTRKTLIFPLLAGAIFAAGCGGGDEPATKPAAAKPAAETAATVVELTGSTFAPETVDVKAGDTISFVNQDEIAHTATASGTFDSGSMAGGAEFSFTAEKAGQISYVCSFHPGMTGTINVT